MKNTLSMIALASALFTGCIADEAPTTDEIEAETSTCRRIRHYEYNYQGSTYRWDVTTELWSGRQFVDERRIGGGFYRQYRVSPMWSTCPAGNESVTLTSSAATITGIHVCLGENWEEFHGSDYQRLLAPKGLSYYCGQ